MSSGEPTAPYVYQKYGSVTAEPARVAAGRLWAVGTPYATHAGLTTITGLTKEEAERVCAALGVVSAQERSEAPE